MKASAVHLIVRNLNFFLVLHNDVIHYAVSIGLFITALWAVYVQQFLDVHQTCKNQVIHSQRQISVFFFLIQDLALIVLGIGTVFSVIFHLGTRERVQNRDDTGERHPLLPDLSTSTRPLLLWKHWFSEPSFYQVTLHCVNFTTPARFSELSPLLIH